MNKWLVIAAGAVAIAGLAINIAVDRDNIYDMTLIGLWVATAALVFIGSFAGRKNIPDMANQSKQVKNH
jgi:hypothetical protein